MCQVEQTNTKQNIYFRTPSCYQEVAICRDAAGGRALFHFSRHIQAAKLAHMITQSEMAEGRRFWPYF